jgi:hypothetical protein
MSSTLPEETDLRRARRARMARRLLLVGIAGFVLASFTGVWGARTSKVTTSGGPYRLTVEYPSITRPGLAVAWSLELTRQGGFSGPVVIAVDGDYFEMFDENATEPEPAQVDNSPSRTLWTFDPPQTATLLVSLDARVEPGVQSSRSGYVEVLERGRPVVRVSFNTTVRP